MNVLLTILASVLVFGTVIFVHELGHFLVAKRCGIKVNEFALGMGPALVKIKRGETTYALRAFPIGGFVSMEGEDEESADEHSFTRAPVYKRVLVIIAGAFMNLVLGFLALAVLVTAGGRIASREIAQVTAPETGLMAGDEILKVNGRRCFVISDLWYEFARTQNGTFDLLVKRGGQKVELENVAFEMADWVDPETGETVMDPATGEPQQYMKLGFTVVGVDLNPWTVTKEAFNNTLSYARMIYLILTDMIMGRVPINQLSGPVGIVSELATAASLGWQPVVELLALITVNLGVVNMLPLPALDGGKVILLVVEAIRRKPLKQKYEMAINVAGFALLILLMVFVTFNDVGRLAGW